MDTKSIKPGLLPVCLGAFLAPFAIVHAATVTSNFNSQIVIFQACNILATANIDFGTQGVLATNVDAAGAVLVTCSSGANFDIGLDAGTTAGGSTTTRKLANGANTVDYILSQNGTHSTNWGDNVGTDTLASIGTGLLQAFPIFARVPAQTTPVPGTYTDTVTVTVTF